MDKENALLVLNKAINEYFKNETLLAGNTRYWDKEFVTSKMLDDDELVSAFREIFSPPINTAVEDVKEVKSERKHKANYVSRVSK